MSATERAAPSTVSTVVLDPLSQFDRQRIDWFSGIVVAAFLSIPVAFALETNDKAAWVVVALGALNVFMGQGLLDFRHRSRAAFLALGLNAVGLAAGSFVATTGNLEFPLIAISITGFELVNLVPYCRIVGLAAGAMFAFGIGIRHTGLTSPVLLAGLALAGGALALAGIYLQRAWIVAQGRHAQRSGRVSIRWEPPDPPLPDLPARRMVLTTAIAAGVAAALAFALGAWLGLAHDYWTILSVIVVLQVGFMATLNTAVVRMTGTVAGAALGGLLVIYVTGAWAVGIAVAALSAITISVRSASPSLYVLSLTPWVLLLLGISSESGWAAAEARVVATLIGGLFALAGAFAAWAILRLSNSSANSQPSRS